MDKLTERFLAIVRNLNQCTTMEQLQGVAEWMDRCDAEYGLDWSEYHAALLPMYEAKMDSLLPNWKKLIQIDPNTSTISGSIGVTTERVDFFNDLMATEIERCMALGAGATGYITDFMEMALKHSQSHAELMMFSMMVGSMKERVFKSRLKMLDLDRPVDDDFINDILKEDQ